MKTGKRGIICICIVFVCNISCLYADEATTDVYVSVLSWKNTTVEFKVHDQYHEAIQGTYILDTLNNSQTILGITDNKGICDLYFPKNHVYSVKIVKKGFEEKVVSFMVSKASVDKKIVDIELQLEGSNPALFDFVATNNNQKENVVIDKQTGINITPIVWAIACLMAAIARLVYIMRKGDRHQS